jgi:predicted MFS family arabinose efflux permease
MAPLGNLYVFGLASVLSGAPMATVMATQSVLISRLAPPAMAAESFTWAATSLLSGIGAGIALGGVLVEVWTPGAVFVAAAGATAAAAVIAAAGLRKESSIKKD